MELIYLNPKAYDKLLAALEKLRQPNKRLIALMKRKAPWENTMSLKDELKAIAADIRSHAGNMLHGSPIQASHTEGLQFTANQLEKHADESTDDATHEELARLQGENRRLDGIVHGLTEEIDRLKAEQEKEATHDEPKQEEASAEEHHEDAKPAE